VSTVQVIVCVVAGVVVVGHVNIAQSVGYGSSPSCPPHPRNWHVVPSMFACMLFTQYAVVSHTVISGSPGHGVGFGFVGFSGFIVCMFVISIGHPLSPWLLVPPSGIPPCHICVS